MIGNSIGSEIGILSNLIRRKIEFWDAQMDDPPQDPPTGMQCQILHYLTIAEQQKQGDRFQRDIETFFHIRRSTATGMLKLLERHGWIRREPVPHDARLKRLVLTDKARHFDESIQKRLEWTENRMQRGIAEADLQVWLRVCAQIRANLEQPPDGQPEADPHPDARSGIYPDTRSGTHSDSHSDNNPDTSTKGRECR